jgi:hypothetical protein
MRMLASHSGVLAALKQKGLRSAWLCLSLWLAPSAVLHAQESAQGLPEIDVYYSLNPLVRASFQAKQTREGGDPTQAELGPSVDLYLKPWIKLQNATIFDLDEAKKRALVFSTGYRVLLSPGTATTNRWELIATANFPLRGGFLLADRNRADLDWQSGKFDWRYRNRLSLESPVRFGSYHPRLYIRDEEVYESQYQKWSTTALYAGGTFPVGKHLDLGPYYCHQNNTGKDPNQQLNQLGLIVNLYVPSRNK